MNLLAEPIKPGLNSYFYLFGSEAAAVRAEVDTAEQKAREAELKARDAFTVDSRDIDE